MRFPQRKKSIFFLVTLVFSGLLSTSAQDTLKTVTAQKGDGILSLLRRHGVNPYEAYEEFVGLNMENLKNSTQLYAGRDYKIPLGTETTPVSEEQSRNEETGDKGENFPIFGKKYNPVYRKSKRLKGTVYYLVAGHGGPDPGAMTTYSGQSIAEDEYAYDITLRLARELITHGALVYVIIRDKDDGIRDQRVLKIDHDEVAYPNKTIPLNQRERLKQRVDVVNKLHQKYKGKFQRLIVTHIDSRSKGQNIDVFFYHHKKSKNGKRLAESIHKTFKQKYKKYQPNRTYSGTFENRTSLYMVKNTHPATAFIEIGNICSKKDQQRILEPDNRQALAKWISEGILLDYESR
jgi:N-acetylmuramoyl-L-alanine amidase